MDLKTRKRFTTTIDIGVQKTLQELSQKTRIPQSKLIDEAIMDLYRKYSRWDFRPVLHIQNGNEEEIQ